MLIEFGFSLLVVSAFISGSAGLFYSEWDRARCAWKAFEATHRARTAEPSLPSGSSGVSVRELSDSFEGEARCGRSKETVRLPKLSSDGALSFSLILILLLVCITGTGMLGLMRHWRHQAEHQMRIDRCVTERVRALNQALQRLKALNSGIFVNRAAIIAATAAQQWEAIPPLKMALRAQVGVQDSVLLLWRTNRMRWLLPTSCGDKDLSGPIPDLGLERGIEDSVGPKGLQWQNAEAPAYRIEILHLPRKSVGLVEPTKGHCLELTNWKSRWSR